MPATRTNWLQLLYSRLIPVPSCAFAGALATDWAYAASANLMWSNFSAWLLLVGLVAGVATVMTGALAIRVRGLTPGWVVTTVVLATAILVQIVNFMIHMRDGWTAVVPEGLALSIVGTLLVLCAAWLGRRPAR